MSGCRQRGPSHDLTLASGGTVRALATVVEKIDLELAREQCDRQLDLKLS